MTSVWADQGSARRPGGMLPLAVLAFLTLLFLGLHLVGAGRAGARWTWGFDSWGRLRLAHWGALIPLVLVAAGLTRWSPGAGGPGSSWQRSRRRYAAYAAVALVTTAAFFLLRSHVVYGDGTESYRELVRGNPLTSLLYRVVGWVLFRSLALADRPPGELVMAIANSLFGGVYVFFALLLGDLVGRRPRDRTLFALAVTSMGSLQLFFGYVEVYAALATGTLIYVYLAARYVRGRCSIGAVAFWLSITFLLHMSAGWFLPSLLLLPLATGSVRLRSPSEIRRTLGVWLRMGGLFVLPVLTYVALLFIVVYEAKPARMRAHYERKGMAIVYGNVSGGGDQSRWVPLHRPTLPTERYTLFSVDHALEIFNAHVLAAGFGGVFLVWLVVFKLRARHLGDPFIAFLATMIGFYVLYSLLWNPGYPGTRDWDLFSVAGNCIALLCGYCIVSLDTLEQDRAVAAALFLGANWLHTVPWILSNHLGR